MSGSGFFSPYFNEPDVTQDMWSGEMPKLVEARGYRTSWDVDLWDQVGIKDAVSKTLDAEIWGKFLDESFVHLALEHGIDPSLARFFDDKVEIQWVWVMDANEDSMDILLEIVDVETRKNVWKELAVDVWVDVSEVEISREWIDIKWVWKFKLHDEEGLYRHREVWEMEQAKNIMTKQDAEKLINFLESWPLELQHYFLERVMGFMITGWNGNAYWNAYRLWWNDDTELPDNSDVFVINTDYLRIYSLTKTNKFSMRLMVNG